MKTYGIIGLGHFGYHIAMGLAEQGLEVIAVDESKEKVKNVSSFIENALVLDSTDKKALKDAGLVDLDVVIVSMGKNIESSILTVMALKDLGNQTIVAKAINPIHGEVLSKIGANKVVYPEKETAKRVVKNIASKVVFEMIDISNSLKGIRFDVPKMLENKTVAQLQEILEGAKLVAYKTNSIWHHEINEQYTAKHNDTLFVVGYKNQAERIYEKVLR